MKRSPAMHLLRPFATLSVLLVALAICILVVFLVVKGYSGLGLSLFFGNTPPLDAIMGLRPVWDGIWPALVGTFCLVILTLLIAVVPGVCCGIYLSQYASTHKKVLAGNMIDMLAGTPSIVMGLFGFILILALRRSFMPSANTCLLLAAFCLALLVLPVLIVTTREALEAVPEHIRINSAALGFTHGLYVKKVLLPAASKGILSGVVLATGRAAEDIAVIMLTGVVANAGLPAGLFSKFEALPFYVFFISAEYQDQGELLRGFSTAIILLCISVLILVLARMFENRYRKRWQGDNSGI